MTWIETISGRRFDLLDPKPEQVSLPDVAHALARNNRFTGHTEVAYSVAEHALHVHYVVAREHGADRVLCAHALHHDAPEAYVGDVSAPMKHAMRVVHGSGVSWFDVIEQRAASAIWQAFGLPEPTPEQRAIVKRADMLALRAEREVFLPATGQHEWACLDGVPLDAALCDRLRSDRWRHSPPSAVAMMYRVQAVELCPPW